MSAIYQDERYDSRSEMPSNKAKMRKIRSLLSGKNKKVEWNIQDGVIQNITVTELMNPEEDIEKQTLNVGWFGAVEAVFDSCGVVKIQKKRNLK